MEKSFKPCSLELKDIDNKKGIVQFYAAAFGNKDSDGDIIVKGAYSKTIKENSKRFKHLKNHDSRLVPGVITSIVEDSAGLLIESQLAQTTLGKDTLIEYEAGIITEHSHGFNIVKSERDENTDTTIIKEIRLWEVSSLTAWGANENTPMVGIKSEKDIEQLIKSIDKILRTSNISDERAIELLKQFDELNKTLKSLTEAATKRTEEVKSIDTINLINNFKL